MRRDVWTAMGPLDEAFALYGQDLDFCAAAPGGPAARSACCPASPSSITTAPRSAAVEQSAGRQHAPMLWTDLLRWAGKTAAPA